MTRTDRFFQWLDKWGLFVLIGIAFVFVTSMAAPGWPVFVGRTLVRFWYFFTTGGPMEVVGCLAVLLIIVLALVVAEQQKNLSKLESKVASEMDLNATAIAVRCVVCQNQKDWAKPQVAKWLRERRGPVECGACGEEMSAQVLRHPFVKNAMAELQLNKHRNEEAMKTLHHLLGEAMKQPTDRALEDGKSFSPPVNDPNVLTPTVVSFRPDYKLKR